MSGCSGCGGGSCSSSPTDNSCSGNCKGDGSCGNCDDCDHPGAIRYVEVPLGVPENHTGMSKPSDGLTEGMHVYLTGSKEYGIITEVRYHNCAIKIDGTDRTSIYDCKMIVPAEEGEEYEKENARIFSPAPPDPFETK